MLFKYKALYGDLIRLPALRGFTSLQGPYAALRGIIRPFGTLKAL